MRVKQELAKAQSQHQLDLKARTAELETHHRVREAQQGKRHADDRQQLMDSFQRELGKIGEEHRKAERELERVHRERETELQRKVRTMVDYSAEKADHAADGAANDKLKEDFLGRWEQHRASLRTRHESVRRTISEQPAIPVTAVTP